MFVFLIILFSWQLENPSPKVDFKDFENRSLLSILKTLEGIGANIGSWDPDNMDEDILNAPIEVRKYPVGLKNGKESRFILGNNNSGFLLLAHESPQNSIFVVKVFPDNTGLIEAKTFGMSNEFFIVQHYTPAGTGIPSDFTSVWFENKGNPFLCWSGFSSFSIEEDKFRFDFTLEDFSFLDGGKLKANYVVQIVKNDSLIAQISLSEKYCGDTETEDLNCCYSATFEKVLSQDLFCYSSLIKGTNPASLIPLLKNYQCQRNTN